MVSSHCSLQVAAESLRTELAQYSAQLTQLRHDLDRVTTERDQAITLTETTGLIEFIVVKKLIMHCTLCTRA